MLRIYGIGFAKLQMLESAQLNNSVVNTMEVQPDFKELLELFNSHGIEFLIVGAYALDAFGFRFSNLAPADFSAPEKVIQLGVPPVRIDLITTITGVSWDQAQAHKVSGIFGGVPVNYIGRDEYVTNKRATGRTKDLADIEALGDK